MSPLVVGGAVVAMTAYLGVVDPNRPGHYLACPIFSLTGLYCAGCGGLRATHDLATGDLVGAWAMNPLWVLVAPLLVVAWLRWLTVSWRGTAAERSAGVDPWRRARAWLPWIFLVVVVGFGVARNVPVLSPWLTP